MTTDAYRRNYAGIDWSGTPQYRPRRRARMEAAGPYFVPDIKPFVSPIDYSEITSRSALREHEQKHNVRQCGELRKPEDFAASRPRETNERALERAYRTALEQKGLL